jgi:D-beta-D-heptose 7-phosphate kinase/D-beta-D-heptose 1-phosphate adenosyltransferase
MDMGKREKLDQVIEGFSKTNILVFGDVMMDRFIWGNVSRISPEAPVPVVKVERETFLLGGAANVVHNIHALGGNGSLCGVVGDDEMGRQIIRDLKKIGIGTQGLFVDPDRQTTVKTRIIAHHQQVVRIDREATDAIRPSTLQALSEFLRRKLERFDGVILSDYEKGLLTGPLIRSTIRLARKAKKFILVDPKLRNFFFYRDARVVTPNTAEASSASGVPILDVPSLKKAGRLLMKKLRCDALVITRGEEGMAIFERHQEPFLVPTVAKEVYDVTGAGDTVIGTMALALATGASVKTAASLANEAAGIVVGKMGTATVSRQELIQAIKETR